MKKQIFDYVKQHPDCTHHQVARALKIDEIQTLSAMQELTKAGYLTVKVRPLGNTVDLNCSVFYYTSRDSYPLENDPLKK